MLIDYCPICGEKLGDFERQTRLNHDKRYHPDYFTAQSGVNRDDLIDKDKWK